MIDKDMIILDEELKNKDEIFNYISERALEHGLISSKEEFLKSLYYRESLMSTALDFNIAIPHAKSQAVENDFISYMKLKEDIIRNEGDANPTNQIFMIAVTEGGSNRHLKYIAEISRNLIDEDFRQSLKEAKSTEKIIAILTSIKMEEE